MKKNTFLTLLAAIALVFLIPSCKSSPAPVEPAPPAAEPAPPSPAGPSPTARNALNTAIARAEAARQRASDFESPSYFPSDWEAAEANYTGLGNLPKSTEAELQQAAAAYNSAADTYDGLFNKTIPLYAQAREDEIIAVRNELLVTGFTDLFPDYLRKADDTALLALNQYENKDYYTARDNAANALGQYQTLKAGADAYLVRQEIVSRDFIPYDPDNFDKADESGLAALELYNSGDRETARDRAEEALLRYNLVLSTGWASYAADRGASAGVERQNALDLKANVAVRDSFNEAESIYSRAGNSFQSEKYEDAAARYLESEGLFIAAGRSAAEKRVVAEEAIKEAEEKIEESDETARKAEIIIEGGSL